MGNFRIRLDLFSFSNEDDAVRFMEFVAGRRKNNSAEIHGNYPMPDGEGYFYTSIPGFELTKLDSDPLLCADVTFESEEAMAYFLTLLNTIESMTDMLDRVHEHSILYMSFVDLDGGYLVGDFYPMFERLGRNKLRFHLSDHKINGGCTCYLYTHNVWFYRRAVSNPTTKTLIYTIRSRDLAERIKETALREG